MDELYYLNNKSTKYVLKMGHCHKVGRGSWGTEAELVSGLGGQRLFKC